MRNGKLPTPRAAFSFRIKLLAHSVIVMHPDELLAKVKRVFPGFTWTFKVFLKSTILTGVSRRGQRIAIHHHFNSGAFWVRCCGFSDRFNSVEDVIKFNLEQIRRSDRFMTPVKSWMDCELMISFMDQEQFPVLTLEQLKESRPIYKCPDLDCSNSYEGDPCGREYCQYHATEKTHPMILESGIEWDDFILEGERHCRAKSSELKRLTQKGWRVGLSANLGGYALFPPSEKVSIANSVTGSYEWGWDEILAFLSNSDDLL